MTRIRIGFLVKPKKWHKLNFPKTHGAFEFVMVDPESLYTTEDLYSYDLFLLVHKIGDFKTELRCRIMDIFKEIKRSLGDLVDDTVDISKIPYPPNNYSQVLDLKNSPKIIQKLSESSICTRKIIIWDSPEFTIPLSNRATMCTRLEHWIKSNDLPVKLPQTCINIFSSDLGLRFPAICKPFSACGLKNSHTMALLYSQLQVKEFIDKQGLELNDRPVNCALKPDEKFFSPILAKDYSKLIVDGDLSVADESRLQGRYILQEYIPHGSVLYKIYVVGDEFHIVMRPTLEARGLFNLFPTDDLNPLDSTNSLDSMGIVVSGSEVRGCERVKALTNNSIFSCPQCLGRDDEIMARSEHSIYEFKASAMKKIRTIDTDSEEGRLAMERFERHRETISFFTQRLRAWLGGMNLFGWDLIISDPSLPTLHQRPNECSDSSLMETPFIIDINYFPGYENSPMLENFTRWLNSEECGLGLRVAGKRSS